MTIQLIDHHTATPAQLAQWLDNLDVLIGEHETELYRHRDCPSGSACQAALAKVALLPSLGCLSLSGVWELAYRQELSQRQSLAAMGG